MRRILSTLLATTTILGARGLRAQAPPIHSLGAVLASSADDAFSVTTDVRALRDGRVLVNDQQRRVVYLLDSTLRQVSAIIGGTAGQELAPYPPAPGGALIQYRGDSTLLYDPLGEQLAVLGPDGKPDRAISTPPAGVFHIPARGAQMDTRGRLVYQVSPTLAPGSTRDSVRLVRLDLTTRVEDTVAMVRVPEPLVVAVRVTTARGAPPPATLPPSALQQAAPGARAHRMVPPFDVSDVWSVTSDGAIMIVRSSDYHVDRIDASGARTSLPPIPLPPQPLLPPAKARLADSLQRVYDSVDARVQRTRGTPGAVRPLVPTNDSITVVRIMPDSLPPFAPGETRVDRDGRIWVREGFRALAGFSGGPVVYDVIASTGQLVDRIQLPADRALAGFGPNGAVYLSVKTALGVRLERATASIRAK